MTKWHFSPKTNKNEKCSSPDNCDYKDFNGGKHFDSIEEANAHMEKANDTLFGKIGKALGKKKSFTTDAHGVKYFGAVPESLEDQERELKKLKGVDRILRQADFRRANGEDIYSQIRDKYSEKEIEAYLDYFPDTGKISGIGAIKTYGEDEADIVGLSLYTGYSDKHEKALVRIIDKLRKGTLQKDDLEYVEQTDGTGSFIFKSRSPYYEYKEPEIPNYDDESAEREENIQRMDENRIHWSVSDNNGSFKELKEHYKDKISPMPKSRDELEKAAIEYEKSRYVRRTTPPINPSTVDEVGNLIISSRDPIVKDMMKATVDAHHNGTLAIGRSVSGASADVFYDKRDISSVSMQRERIKDRKVDEAKERITPVRQALSKVGTTYAVSPRVEWDGDSQTASYHLNYGVPGDKMADFKKYSNNEYGTQIFGTFTEAELKKIADGDYSVIQK